MKKRSLKQRAAILLPVFLLAVLLLWGCRAAQEKPAESPAPTASAPETPGTSAPEAPDTVSVTDCSGRTVQVPGNARRVACLYAYTGHVCVLLGCEDRIVAVVNGLKRDQLMLRKVPSIADMTSPYSSGSINVEELLTASPDLIFLREENLVDVGETEKLDSIGIPYLTVDYVTMEDQIRSIEMMGQALGREDRAAAYTDYYRDTVEMVKERLSALPEEERLSVYHSVNEVVRTDIPDTLSYQILEAAGCRNVVTSSEELRLDGNKGMTTVEQIYVWDPDVILVTEPDAAAYFETNEKFAGLRAVREGKVMQMPVGISRWAHPGSVETPLAVLYIGQLLYPELFPDVDMEKELRSFYRDFFDITLSDEDVRQIFLGRGMRDAREGKKEE